MGKREKGRELCRSNVCLVERLLLLFENIELIIKISLKIFYLLKIIWNWYIDAHVFDSIDTMPIIDENIDED